MQQASMNTRWLSGPLPDHPAFEQGIRRAPRREPALGKTEKERPFETRCATSPPSIMK